LVCSALDWNFEYISDDLSVRMTVKLSQWIIAPSLCFGHFSRIFQFPYWSFACCHIWKKSNATAFSPLLFLVL
jgi:hypothetical protein